MSTQPSSFCTLCTGPSRFEARILIRSIQQHHQNTPIHVLCDDAAYYHLNDLPGEITFHIHLQYQKIGRYQRDEEATTFFMRKADVIDLALQESPDTLFLDADQVVLAPLEVKSMGYSIGVAPAFLRSDVSDRVGYYSGGLMWVKSMEVTQRWRELAKDTKYVDQGAIEYLVHQFPHFRFNEGYNFRCWRFKFGPEPMDTMKKKTAVIGSEIFYDDKPIRTVHTHFDDPKFLRFNRWFIGLLKKAGRDEVVKDIRSLPSLVAKAITM